MRSKAEFHALRELVGYTQQAMADELGVKVLSVKRWESPKYPQQAPDDAWAILDAALDDQQEVVEFALAKIDELSRTLGHVPDLVELRYWTSEEEYLAWSTDAKEGIIGDWRMANANARAAAAVLMSKGFDIAWSNAPLVN